MQCLINAKVSAALLPLLQWPIILVWIFWKKATVLSFNHVNHDIVEADNVVNNGRKLLNRMNFTQQYWITEKLERVFPVFNISTNSLFFYQPNRLLQFTNTEQFVFSIPSKFLNVCDFGKKMYTSWPITAQLFFQEDLWLAERCTYLCSNRTHAWVNKSCVTALFEVAYST